MPFISVTVRVYKKSFANTDFRTELSTGNLMSEPDKAAYLDLCRQLAKAFGRLRRGLKK